jgi:hypothetical protein
MVLTGGGGKEADILVRYMATTKNYIHDCKQVFNCKASVSLVSLIIEIHNDPSGRISECFVMQALEALGEVIRAQNEVAAAGTR